MCFFTEAQQRAFDAIQQRRAAQATAAAQQQGVMAAGFNPFAASTPSLASSASTAVMAAPQPLVGESAAATVAKAFAQSDPELVTRFIQEVVAHQLQQQQQAHPFSFAQQFSSPSPANAMMTMMTPAPVAVMECKRPLEDMDASIEPQLKRQKIDADAMSESGDRNSKKRRFVWTPELRDVFDRAVASLEPELVGPKNIYGMMLRLSPTMVRESELNTQHIKSHLQKWRIAKRRHEDGSSMLPEQPSPSSYGAQQPPYMTAPPQSFAMLPAPTSVHVHHAPAMNVSPEVRNVQEAPQMPVPGVTFLSPPVPPPKASAVSELDSPLLFEGLDDTSDPLISSWDALFADAAPAKDDDHHDGGMLASPSLGIPADVLSELSKASSGSDGLSSTDILKYMMLGYQLGFQNCFPAESSSTGAAAAAASSSFDAMTF